MPRTRVLKISDLPPGSRKIVESDGYEIALFNVSQNIYAVSNICPHNGGSLGQGLISEDAVTCPLHYFKFSLRTGKSLNQPSYRLETYPVKIEEDWIYLDLPEEDLEE